MAHASTTLLTQLPIDPSERPQYDLKQLQAYFRRIRLPQEHCATPILHDHKLANTKEHGLPLLRALQLYHLANIPFENLELHYSAKKSISLNMDDLYQKFVVRGENYSRGGRCMEHNGFFGTVLRSLGYDVRNCAGRVSRAWNPDSEIREQQAQTYDPWNHMLNLVNVEGVSFVVDVGMGAMGPNIVYPLEDGYETAAIPPRRIRLQKRSIPEHSLSGVLQAQQLWCYDQCLKPDQPGQGNVWIPTYCFTETEFLPQDYEMMSFFTSHHRRSFFIHHVLCTRMLIDEASQKVVGDITLFNRSVRKTTGGVRETLADLKTEEERVNALKNVLGVDLTAEEKTNISTEIRLGQRA
ncbi:arylamine N-acetyltransferase 1 [Sphaerulina musiva SO2202]|uniref:Arylamine N-acetyltransferase 1 n=1 Tax=Sphaerulina musiva (strain SO2202) TaxID=692275 RepID=M3CHR0_SPHMS|nr:arylamine N-acetyltransferase 1 [Sphaerulina musiva SO2202]EMF13323.1 arylamine N-acetyltransferase 1 [Sphaerulina musiva SO2202]